MWMIMGIWFIFVQPGVIHLQKVQWFDTPQECFQVAMEVMNDNTTPLHMACVPRYKIEGEA